MDAAAERARRIPDSIAFPSDLPISKHLDEIQTLLENHQVVIVAGDTGSGKTTQLPKMCLKAGFGKRGFIGHTQPRRIAARRVATRVAEELSLTLGDEIGYAMRFSDQCPPQALIKLMTDGLLLAEIRSDRSLSRYEVLIVDEAHERSLNIDFLLGYLKQLMPARKDLKILITSATIDVETYSRHFDDAPIVEVSGRSYPIELRYREPLAGEDLADQIVSCLQDIKGHPAAGSSAQDLLVFLSGEREIFETARELRQRLAPQSAPRQNSQALHAYEVLPLYARLTASEQNRIFQPGAQRRIVLATNVAETSLTVPNIGYVLDPGWARTSRYSFRSKLQRLPIEPISQASARQRMGRCGRIAPGRCYRLYSEDDFLSRPEYSEPEIKRTNLAAVVLQMRAFKLGDIHHFPFLEPPEPGAVRDAMRLLEELKALKDGRLTSTGHAMARLPVDPRLARMIVEASKRGVLREILIISSAMSIQDPRERPLEKQAQADQKHSEFADEQSDFLSLVKLWDWYEARRQELSGNALKRSLRKRFLSVTRMREWRDLHRQLVIVCHQLGYRMNESDGGYTGIHQAVLSGSLSLIGMKYEKGEYLGARNLKFRIFPGSAVYKKTPSWIVCSEVAETRRVYGRGVAAIQPGWVEMLAGHLVNRSFAEPHWNPRRGEVTAAETVTLYGLTLAENRQVSFKSQDPDLCRELLIREGLLSGALQTQGQFLTHNLTLVRQVIAEEEKLRIRGLVADEGVLAAFYAERIPADIVDTRSFERWRKKAEQSSPRLLFMTQSDVLQGETAPDQEYPSTLELDGVTFALKYSFAPGETHDGVSLRVPIGLLPHITADPLEWLVPGFLAQKCEALLKSLPKSDRRQLAPVPDKVDELLPTLLRPGTYRRGRLTHTLGELVEGFYGVRIDTRSWSFERVPDHLRLNVQVCDEAGKILRQSRDLSLLKRELQAPSEPQSLTRKRLAIEQKNLTEFPSEKLPNQLILKNNTIVYPALKDQGKCVEVVLCRSLEEQRVVNRAGYSRLVLLYQRQSVRFFRAELKKERDLGLYFAALGTAGQLEDQLLQTAAWACFFEGKVLPQTRVEMINRLSEGKSRLTPTFFELVASTKKVVKERFELVKVLAEISSPAYAGAVHDVKEQLERLLPKQFLQITPSSYLIDIPRYLQAAQYRLSHLQGRVEKDSEAMAEVAYFDERLLKLHRELGNTPAVIEFRFAIEEYRVGLFAQQLGTRAKISRKRLLKLSEPLVQAAEISD